MYKKFNATNDDKNHKGSALDL